MLKKIIPMRSRPEKIVAAASLNTDGDTESEITAFNSYNSQRTGAPQQPQQQPHNHHHQHNSTSALGGPTTTATAMHSSSQSPLVSVKKRDIDPHHTSTHMTHNGNQRSNSPTSYYAQRMIGSGAFGTVYIAKAKGSDETVAIKRYVIDRKFRNREVHIMQQISQSNGGKGHPHIVRFITNFTTTGSIKGGKSEETFSNLVLEYVPETVHSMQKQYMKRRQGLPDFILKLYMYQMLRALAHIHGMGIAHRDIKPQNLLVDPLRHTLKLCDFGSAKMLVKGEANVAYICSRFYRAPELILGSTEYSTAIDVWSAGCVFAEMMLGRPVFPGMSAADQLIEIVKVLGTPSAEQVTAMNHTGVTSHGLHAAEGSSSAPIRIPPNTPSKSWKDVLPSSFTGPSNPFTIPLLEQLLKYSPQIRIKAIDACAHAYFHEIRDPLRKLPDGSPIPLEMLTFTAEELSIGSFETMRFLSENQTAMKTKRSNSSSTAGTLTTSSSSSGLPLGLSRSTSSSKAMVKDAHSSRLSSIRRAATMSETSSGGSVSSSDDEE